jgi:hypothetical protein
MKGCAWHVVSGTCFMWSPVQPQMQIPLACCSLFCLAPVFLLDGGQAGVVLAATSEVVAIQVHVNMYVACIYVHGKCCYKGLTQLMWQTGWDFEIHSCPSISEYQEM